MIPHIVSYTVSHMEKDMLQESVYAMDITNLGPIGFSQLACTYPLPVVKEILESHDRATWRMRKLPNELIVYFSMLMSLDRTDSATETVLKMLEDSQTIFGRQTKGIPGKGGISDARTRVGFEPLKTLFDTCCVPLAKEPTPFTHFQGMPLFALDGTTINVLDTEANSEFGYSKNQNSHSVNPKMRAVALVECGTHAVIGVELGGYHDSEITLAHPVIKKIPKNSLITADRLFLGWRLVRAILKQDAQILWRVKSSDGESRFEIKERLKDGSYRASYIPPKDRTALKKLEGLDLTPIEVRVCSYLPYGGKEMVHLVTTLLDESVAPATKLAELYMQRWEVEQVFSEMKVCLNKNEHAMRSQKPDLVKQEFYGLVTMHYSIRALMYEAATRSRIDPDLISFKGAVKTIDRKLLKSGVFSP